MSEEEKNKQIRIKQQKYSFIRNIVVLVLIFALISIIFWSVNKTSQGKEISFDEFRTELVAGNIKEVRFNNNKILISYQDNTAHYMLYSRGTVEEESILLMILERFPEGSENGPIIKFGTTTTISILNILYPILSIVILIVMIVFILRQVRGANNKSFDFVKSRARIYPSKTKFSDVAGEDEEKEELQDVVDFLKNPKKYVELGAKIPKGVLLVGPPGTGKTLLARAVAGEANVPFFTISGSDFMELFVGVGASRVRDLFENAKKAKPCIIFIDEIDAVGRQRGAGLGGGNDEREQTLNQLLVQMDGFEDNEGIIVMAATNRVDILDPALLRPGRFDRRVNINIPDIKGREEILKVHAKNKPIAKSVDFKTIARITAGFTGAEIENLLNEAAILVAKENRKEIEEEDIQKSIMKVTLGPQKRSRVIDEKDKYDTAIHESGHAIISKLAKEKSPVHEVSIIPRGGAGGYTVSTDDDATVYFKEKLLSKIQMLLGGITAEKLFIGDISTGVSNDLKRATSIARRMVTEWGMSSELGMVYCGSDDEVFIGKTYQERMQYSEDQAAKIDVEIKKIIDSCQKETERILTKNKNILLTMANVLIEKETIYAEEVDLILAGKSKEEIIEYIENKDKNSKNSSENSEKIDENAQKSENVENQPKNDEQQKKENLSVEELLKLAEDREKQLDENTKVSEEKSVQETVQEKPIDEATLNEENKEVKNVKKSEEKLEEKSAQKKANKTLNENEKETEKKTSRSTKTGENPDLTKKRKKSSENTKKIVKKDEEK